MISHADRFWRERAALRYLDALDAGDLDAVFALWDEAATDPELEALLHELNEGVEAEDGPAADDSRVIALARATMPSAFPPDKPAGPLTAAEVARRLEAEPEFRRFGPADRANHARLLADASPIPGELGQGAVDRWLEGLGVAAGEDYRRLFRKAAVLMSMARGQDAGRLAAARRAEAREGADRDHRG